MKLEKFVEASLQQIIRGVEQAQTGEGGEQVNAKAFFKDTGGNLISGGSYGMFTRIDFDIAVSGETSGKGGASLKVLGVGLDGGGEHKTTTANRIRFSVPVRLPDGDLTRAEDVAQARSDAQKKRAQHRAEYARQRTGRNSWLT